MASPIDSSVMCTECKCTESSFWHKISAAGGVLCTTCYCQRDRPTRRHALSSSGNSTSASKVDERCLSDNSVKCASTNITRKSNRLKPFTKNRLSQNIVKPSSTKGRSKRYIFKKNVKFYVFIFVFKKYQWKIFILVLVSVSWCQYMR